jgi:hypothetical protein
MISAQARIYAHHVRAKFGWASPAQCKRAANLIDYARLGNPALLGWKMNLLQQAQMQAQKTFPNLGALPNSDITAVVSLVMMEAAESAEDDLKSLMDGVQLINKQKSALRAIETNISQAPDLKYRKAGLDSLLDILANRAAGKYVRWPPI